MAELMEIYNNVKSPLEDDALVNKLIKEYIKSSRRFFVGQGKTGAGLYDAMTALGREQDETLINQKDQERFYINLYNEWIKNVLSLSAEQIEKLHGRGRTKYNKLQEALATIKIKKYEDVKAFRNDDLIGERTWEVENPGWIEVKSREISVLQEKSLEIKHILYLGLKNEDIFSFMDNFVEECIKNELPYYFKISKQLKRKDKVVIYSNIEYLTDYLDILRRIARNNKEIIKRMSPPPDLVGVIDGWIGIGDEPVSNGTSTRSYYGVRAELIEDAIESATIEAIEKYKGSKLKLHDEMITFNSMFLKECNRYITEKLDYQRLRVIYEDTEKFKSEFGISVSEIGTEKLNKYLLKGLKNNIQKGLNRLKEVQNDKNTMLSANNLPIFTIETRNGRGIYISINDMDRILKRMIPILIKFDRDYINIVRNNIEKQLQKEFIDVNKFVFLEDTRSKFELMDKSRAMLQGIKREENLVKKEQKVEEIVKEEIIKEEPVLVEQVNENKIIDEIEPSLLEKQYITPFGDIVDGKRYIKDYIIPIVPENGKFLLINNVEIPAKKFIEEVILKLINKKFRGDLDLLLAKTTKKPVEVKIDEELENLLKDESLFVKEEKVEDYLGKIVEPDTEKVEELEEKTEEKVEEDLEEVEEDLDEDELIKKLNDDADLDEPEKIEMDEEKQKEIDELLQLMKEVETLKETKKRLKQQLRHTRNILNSRYDANL